MDDNNTILIVVLLLGAGMVYLMTRPKPKANPYEQLGGAIGKIISGFV